MTQDNIRHLLPHESRWPHPGHSCNDEMKRAIEHYGGVVVREDDLWLFLAWLDAEAAHRFETSGMYLQKQQERKQA